MKNIISVRQYLHPEPAPPKFINKKPHLSFGPRYAPLIIYAVLKMRNASLCMQEEEIYTTMYRGKLHQDF